MRWCAGLAVVGMCGGWACASTGAIKVMQLGSYYLIHNFYLHALKGTRPGTRPSLPSAPMHAHIPKYVVAYLYAFGAAAHPCTARAVAGCSSHEYSLCHACCCCRRAPWMDQVRYVPPLDLGPWEHQLVHVLTHHACPLEPVPCS
jgi:hypothetical protein